MESPTTVLDRRIDATDAWSLEARRVALLSAELGVALDGDALMLCDIYDLRSLQRQLRQALAGTRRYRLARGSLAVTTPIGHDGGALTALRRLLR